MKISLDGQELFTLSEVQKKVIKNDIHEDIFEVDMKRRLQYILMHKYEKCMDRLRNEWIPKFRAEGIASIPLNDDELAKMIFAHPDYKCRKQRDLNI